MSGPLAHITYQWYFPNYPGGPKEVIEACEEHIRRLWPFIYEFRMEWEAANDPGALDRKLDILFGEEMEEPE